MFRHLSALPDIKLLEYICMVVHSCIIGRSLVDVNMVGGQPSLAVLIQHVVRVLSEKDVQWGQV